MQHQDNYLQQIKTSRLVLSRPQLDDLPAVFEIHSDPKANLFNPSGVHLSIDKSLEVLKKWLSHWNEQGFGYWTVFMKFLSQLFVLD